jgi:hypothetical protein
MKIRPVVAALTVTWLLTSFASASTLLVEGFLEGDVLPGPELGDTMDFYKFQVFTPGSVRVEIVPGYEGFLLLVAQYIGRTDEFGFIDNPYRIEPPGPTGKPQYLERFLDIGEYVVAMTAGGDTSYDIFDGYKAVNREGGGFGQAPYAYTIAGNVRGLEYWDGHLDDTFIITSIPEPCCLFYLGGSVALLFRGRFKA